MKIMPVCALLIALSSQAKAGDLESLADCVFYFGIIHGSLEKRADIAVKKSRGRCKRFENRVRENMNIIYGRKAASIKFRGVEIETNRGALKAVRWVKSVSKQRAIAAEIVAQQRLENMGFLFE